MVLEKLFFFLLGLDAVYSRHVQFYRKDYTYIEEFDAFYKIHWDNSGLSWNTAFLACEDEGSRLFYPKSKDEWAVVKNLTAAMTVKPNVTDIFVGVHDEFGLGEFITVDGRPTPLPLLGDVQETSDDRRCIVMDIESGLYALEYCATDHFNLKPFVCKKVEDESCPTVDQGYKYVKEVNRCYKINDRKKTWHEAMQTCYAEGAILAVVENGEQAAVVRNAIITDQAYFTGFRKVFSYEDLYTVKGLKLQSSGYQRWYDENSDRNEECGVIYDYNNSLYTKTVNCVSRLPFVCEMNVKST